MSLRPHPARLRADSRDAATSPRIADLHLYVFILGLAYFGHKVFIASQHRNPSFSRAYWSFEAFAWNVTKGDLRVAQMRPIYDTFLIAHTNHIDVLTDDHVT